MVATIQQLEGQYLATLKGELNTAAALEVEEILKPLYKSDGCDVTIDCTELEYIASSGLRILISILKGAKAGGSRVVLKKVNDDIIYDDAPYTRGLGVFYTEDFNDFGELWRRLFHRKEARKAEETKEEKTE